MLECPKPLLEPDQRSKFLKDPEVLTLESLFVLTSVLNVLILYRLMVSVCPFPVALTWFQLLGGLLSAVVLGAAGQQFPKLAYFPPFSFSASKAKELLLSTSVFLGMITLGNVLLANCPNVATYPVIVAVAVVMHHATRFLGCGQVYVPIRWIAVGVMTLGFLIAAFDWRTMGPLIFLFALLYGICSAVFRGWCLEKALHIVEGQGNQLHNQQVVAGLISLPIMIAITGDWRMFTWMPYDINKAYTWQKWGCVVTAAFLPFLKNIVANRLIRKTGQVPWRALELLSVLVIFVTGLVLFRGVSIVGWISVILVLAGRGLGMMDAMSRPEPEPPVMVHRVPRQRNAGIEEPLAPPEAAQDREAPPSPESDSESEGEEDMA